VGSCVSALIGRISNNEPLVGLPDGFRRIATREFAGIRTPYPAGPLHLRDRQ
jgi:hypothetical protein